MLESRLQLRLAPGFPSRRLESVAAKRALDEFRSARRRDQAAPFITVGGQRGVDGVRRDHRAELGTGGAVAGAGTFSCTSDNMPGDRGEDYRVPPGHGVPAQVGNEVKQPRHFPDD
jgi:hypothetical protein